MADKLITRSRPLFDTGTIVSQIAPFVAYKTLHKASLNFTVTNADLQNFAVGSAGIVTFPAASFRESRDAWVFHPVLHWLPVNNWETSGVTMQNTMQSQLYAAGTDAAFNAPFLKYQVFFDIPGVYNLWGYGYTSSGVFWSWDDDVTHMRQFTLGSPSGPPEWTKFGTIESPEGGLHTFAVYLSDAVTVVLDQWHFTQDETDLSYPFVPLSSSKTPFTTGVRVRSLATDGGLDNLETPSSGTQRAVAWLSSKDIVASGKYNYELQNTESGSGVTYSDGVSIETWQTGGSSEHFAAWDFILPDGTSVGDSFVSTDHGENFTVE